MMTREELDQALEMLYEPDFDDLGRNTTPVRYPLDVIGAAARKQLALMAETCRTCGGRGFYHDGDQVSCPTCHGSGYLYPAETIRRINRALDQQPREKAVAVLDAINDLDQEKE